MNESLKCKLKLIKIFRDIDFDMCDISHEKPLLQTIHQYTFLNHLGDNIISDEFERYQLFSLESIDFIDDEYNNSTEGLYGILSLLKQIEVFYK